MHARQSRGIIAMAILALAMGCARSGRSAPGVIAFDETATARITNNGWLDVNVYASRSGSRQRLGTVTGQNTQVFELPRSFVDARGLRIFIDAIARRRRIRQTSFPPDRGSDRRRGPAAVGDCHYSVLTP